MKFLEESEKELSEDIISLKEMYTETYKKFTHFKKELKRLKKRPNKRDKDLLNYLGTMLPDNQSDFIDVTALLKNFMNSKKINAKKIRKVRDIYLKLIINIDNVTLNLLKKSNWTMFEQISLYLDILNGVECPNQVENLNNLKQLTKHRKGFVQQSGSVDGLVRAKILCNFFVKWLTKAENEFTDRELQKSLEMQKQFTSTLKRVLSSLSNAKAQAEFETKYEARIEYLRELIKRSEEEPKFQAFFEENPDFLSRNVKKVISQKSFGGELIPDLILILSNGNYLIVELEKPAFKLFTSKGNPTKYLSHAEQQIRGYLTWAKEDKDYLIRRGLNNLSSDNVTGLVIIGAKLSSNQKKKLESLNNTIRSAYSVKTFDDILEENEICLENLRKYPLKEKN